MALSDEYQKVLQLRQWRETRFECRNNNKQQRKQRTKAIHVECNDMIYQARKTIVKCTERSLRVKQ